MTGLRSSLLVLALLLSPLVAAQPAPEGATPVVVRAVAVAHTPDGLVGSVANLSISQQPGGGLLFMDTQPYTQVDMQGSARLAVRVAGAVTGLDVSQRDFFFVVRSGSQIIGGPSAGGIMTVGAIAALKGWDIHPHVYMTGTINLDGSIGPVGGIPEKAAAAAQRGARLFLYPVGEELTARTTPQGHELVNMSRYCRGELGLECRAVAHVEEAVSFFTGHAFERPPLEDVERPARLLEAMRPMAREQLDATDARVDAARASLREAQLSASVRRDLESAIDRARLALLDGEEAYEEDHPYTAASAAFRAAIDARYVQSVLDYSASERPPRVLREHVAEAQSAIDEASRLARAADVHGVSQLEAVGAAQLRVTDAERTLASAQRALDGGEVLAGLASLAFAHERALTVPWWLDIGETFRDGEPIETARVRVEAQQALTEALQLVTYAQETLTAGGYALDTLSGARDLLDRAQRDLARGLPAAALYEALEAQVRASVALETAAFGERVPEARLARAQQEAARAIHEARAAGVEPVVAASDYELAGDMPPGVDRLVFYDLARIIARSGDYFAAASDDAPAPSRYVGTPPMGPRGSTLAAGLQEAPLAPAWPVGALGGLVAFGLGLAWGRRRARREDAAPSWSPAEEPPQHPTLLEPPR